MAQCKPLFVPWLRQQIDGGGYPGVQWVNPERTHFSIPWKHALRQDANSDDVLIFKAWAQTSASPDGRIPGDPSVWKRNFRSALRARRFTLVEDNKNDAANPHKVFRFPEGSQSAAESGDARSESQETSPGSDTLGTVLYQDESQLFLDGSQTPDLLEQCLSGLNIHEAQPVQCDVQGSFYQHGSPDQYQFCDARFPVQETGHVQEFSPAEGAVGGVACSPAEVAPTLVQSPHNGVFEGTRHQPVEPGVGSGTPAQGASNDSEPTKFETQFMVKVYYKGEKVLEQLVENGAGFQLVYKEDVSRMASDLGVVKLPGADRIMDQTQARFTQEILNNLGGLEVRLEGGMLCGYRWGESRVYWGLNKHEQGSRPRQLAKNQPEPLYYPKEFISDLIKFMHTGRESPSPFLYFCLGQQWPDPRNRPWERMLIMVEVVLMTLENLKLMAVSGGASSLQSSIELQISLEQMMDWF
ncbi:interferon regulatory factor 3 isoform X2 [Trichomycterus rosablanca]|uniref:interferon regulatory factor 3 isoform X2 n=1 Tax=Trichomycterus rosablanca TaxID=2290929 RepID=UPI002F35F646